MTATDQFAAREGSFSLKCFGVGNGWPSPDRNGSSYLYRFQKQALLIDCGESISRSYRAARLDYNLIDQILLSHLHFDHLGGYFMMMQGFWLRKRNKELKVHLPSDGIKPIRELLNAGCIFDELIGFPVSYEPLEAGKSFEAGDVRVTPFPTTHLHMLRDMFSKTHPQRYEAFSFLLEQGELRIGHSADIGSVQDLRPLVDRPLDLLVCELAHVDPEELFRFVQPLEIRKIVLVHLGDEQRPQLRRLKALAAKTLGRDRVAWPLDGAEFKFGKPDAQWACSL